MKKLTKQECWEAWSRSQGDWEVMASILNNRLAAQTIEGGDIEMLRQYVEHMGSMHDEDCPLDDTCNCSAKPIHDAVNRICSYTSISPREGGEQETLVPAQHNTLVSAQGGERETHLRHCNKGEYVGSCKYHEADCPAIEGGPKENLPDGWMHIKKSFYEELLAGQEGGERETPQVPYCEGYFSQNNPKVVGFGHYACSTCGEILGDLPIDEIDAAFADHKRDWRERVIAFFKCAAATSDPQTLPQKLPHGSILNGEIYPGQQSIPQDPK
jgi:hypothetical protein